jgi:hypothetical protein
LGRHGNWAAEGFGPGGGNGVTQPTVDVKALHAKIDEPITSRKFKKSILSLF